MTLKKNIYLNVKKKQKKQNLNNMKLDLNVSTT